MSLERALNRLLQEAQLKAGLEAVGIKPRELDDMPAKAAAAVPTVIAALETALGHPLTFGGDKQQRMDFAFVITALLRTTAFVLVEDVTSFSNDLMVQVDQLAGRCERVEEQVTHYAQDELATRLKSKSPADALNSIFGAHFVAEPEKSASQTELEAMAADAAASRDT